MYSATIASSRYVFPDLKTLLAKASPARSGDQLAGIAAASGEERVAAQYALADVPLTSVLEQPVIPYESDEVTRLIVDTHDRAAFGEIAHLTVGGLRDWLLSDAPTAQKLAALARGITPEMAAAVAKISGLKDLMVMAAKCSVVTRFRDTISSFPAACRCGCSPTIRPTICAPSPRASSTGSCSAPATPSSASTPQPTVPSARMRCSRCWTRCAPSSTSRPRPACWLT